MDWRAGACPRKNLGGEKHRVRPPRISGFEKVGLSKENYNRLKLAKITVFYTNVLSMLQIKLHKKGGQCRGGRRVLGSWPFTGLTLFDLLRLFLPFRFWFINRAVCAVAEDTASGEGGQGFHSSTGQIGHSIANGSPPLRLFSELCCPDAKPRRWAPPLYALPRNTANED